MPYINSELRGQLDRFDQQPPNTGAELNYVIARLLARYTSFHGLSYETITQVRGAASGALDEYNRIVAHPYEEQKRHENGDIWEVL